MQLRPWADDGLAVLEAANTPAMKAKLGGPETAAQVLTRHRRYLAANRPGGTEMFLVDVDSTAVGAIGYWPREWNGQQVYETGWEILTEHQGRGYATAASRLLLDHLLSVAEFGWVHAYPSPENPASNAICRALGFTCWARRASNTRPDPPSRSTTGDWHWPASKTPLVIVTKMRVYTRT